MCMPLRPGQHQQAKTADQGPEERSRPPGKCQGQSGGARKAEDLANQYVSTLIGADISGIKVAYGVQQLAQPFDDQGSEVPNVRAQQPKNDAHLQNSQALRGQIQRETTPKQLGGVVVKIKERVLHGLNQLQPLADPPVQARDPSDDA